MTEAVIKATYSDYRRVKGRKVLQLIYEVPLEMAPQVHEVFGEPSPDGSTWVAIARLQSQPEAQPTAERPKTRWGDLSRAQQAGMMCNDAEFVRFLGRHDRGVRVNLNGAAAIVKEICGVSSRVDLNTDVIAADKWDKLYSDYQLYRRGAAA